MLSITPICGQFICEWSIKNNAILTRPQRVILADSKKSRTQVSSLPYGRVLKCCEQCVSMWTNQRTDTYRPSVTTTANQNTALTDVSIYLSILANFSKTQRVLLTSSG